MESNKDAQEVLQSIYNLAVTDLNDGSDFDSIVDELVTKGLNKEAALTIVAKAADEQWGALYIGLWGYNWRFFQLIAGIVQRPSRYY